MIVLNHPRRLLHEIIKRSDTDLKSVSEKLGKNHAYLQQYLTRGTPRVLSDAIREGLGRILGLDPNIFREEDDPLRVDFAVNDYTPQHTGQHTGTYDNAAASSDTAAGREAPMVFGQGAAMHGFADGSAERINWDDQSTRPKKRGRPRKDPIMPSESHTWRGSAYYGIRDTNAAGYSSGYPAGYELPAGQTEGVVHIPEYASFPFAPYTTGRGKLQLDMMQERWPSPIVHWSIPYDFIRSYSGEARNLVILRVSGNAMEPEYHVGDRILVDLENTTPSPEGVFLVSDGVSVVMKRLEVVFGSEPPVLGVKSDHPAYDSWRCALSDLVIYGRVVGKWSWK